MKTKIYLITLATLFLVAVMLVITYSTQDFTEDIKFVDKINYADINFTTYSNGPPVRYLQTATAELGTVELKNNGMFPQKYDLPHFIGCIEFSPSIQKYIQFSINSKAYPYESMTIQIGQTMRLSLTGEYNNRGREISFSDLTRENIKSIKVFRLQEREYNPIYSEYNYYYGSNECDNLLANKIPLAEIKIE